MKKTDTNRRAWNVLTLTQSGKLKQLAKETRRLNVEIMGLFMLRNGDEGMMMMMKSCALTNKKNIAPDAI